MFQLGDRVNLSGIGELSYADQAKGESGVVTRATNLDGWTDVKWDNGHENNYEVEDLIRLVPIAWAGVTGEAPALKAEPVPQAPQPTRSGKYLYSVETADGETQIMSTRDREHARQVKAYCGGKKEGIIIQAYAPVKEIR